MGGFGYVIGIIWWKSGVKNNGGLEGWLRISMVVR